VQDGFVAPGIYRSAREATGALLLEQARPGDFVTVGGMNGVVAGGEAVFGRVLPEDDPSLEGRRPQIGKVFLRTGDGMVQEFSEQDLKVVQAMDVPGETLRTLSVRADEAAMQEVLADIINRRKKKKRPDDPFKDKEKSMTQRFAQRAPLTRLAKSDKMKKVWRGVKGKASYQGGGLRQEGIEEQGLSPTDAAQVDRGPGDITDEDEPGEQFGTEPTKLDSKDMLDSEEAWWLTQRTFELADDMIRSLSIHKGMVYFQEMEDDATEGIVRITLNGTCPREIVDQFMADATEDMDLKLLEEPEGTLEDHDLRGKWVIEGRVLVDEEEPEEEEEDYPGEVDVEAGLGGEAIAPQEAD
jgi:hypothetical protein